MHDCVWLSIPNEQAAPCELFPVTGVEASVKGWILNCDSKQIRRSRGGYRCAVLALLKWMLHYMRVFLPLLRTNKWNSLWSPRVQMFLLTFGSTQSGELYNHDLTVWDKALCGGVRKDVGTKLWSHLCKAGWVNLSEKLQHFKKNKCNPLLNIILLPQQIRWCSYV